MEGGRHVRGGRRRGGRGETEQKPRNEELDSVRENEGGRETEREKYWRQRGRARRREGKEARERKREQSE